MRPRALFAAVAVFAAVGLAACGGNDKAGSGGSGGAGAPAKAASAAGGFIPFPGDYRATIRVQSSQQGAEAYAGTIVVYRSGPMQRLEMRDPTGRGTVTAIINTETKTALSLIEAAGQRLVMEVPFTQTPVSSVTDQEAALRAARKGGPCVVAQVPGITYLPSSGNSDFSEACVSDDGIVLRLTKDGQVIWEVLELAVGPQPAGLFERPAGATDLGGLAKQFGAK